MTAVRPTELALGGVELTLPILFPSVSSLKTTLDPKDYLTILHSLRNINSQFLVSAFDLVKSAERDVLKQLLIDMEGAGLTILMDSGNYESFWKDERELWRPRHFHEVLSEVPFSFTFSFDEQQPPDDTAVHVELIVEQWRADTAAASGSPVVPIIHGDPELLPFICSLVVERTQVPMVAVAERRLGDGLLQRLRSVQKLREMLDRQDRYIGLHLLGTANPISIALYTYAGADSFDGLEWCRTVVDHETASLSHLSHAEFFWDQTDWGDIDLTFHARVLAHNLTFYTDWMLRLQDAHRRGRLLDFMRANLSRHVWQHSARNFGWGEA